MFSVIVVKFSISGNIFLCRAYNIVWKQVFANSNKKRQSTSATESVSEKCATSYSPFRKDGCSGSLSPAEEDSVSGKPIFLST